MTRLDWEKAKLVDARNARERRAVKRRGERDRAARQEAMVAFVVKHGLACFKCKTNDPPWAKTGISRRGPWAICLSCRTSGQ